MKLYQHQINGIQKSTGQNLALFWQPGCGKTLAAIEIARHWIAEGPCLVVCPLSIIGPAWMNDLAKFAPDLRVVSLWARSVADRRKALAQPAEIYVANYDGVKILWNDILAKGFQTVIVDESSKLKNPKAQITQAMLSLAGIVFRRSKYKSNVTIRHRYVLSGTPAPNDMQEYWAQVKFVSGPGGPLSDNYYVFRGQYCLPIKLGNTGVTIWKFNASLRKPLMDRIAPASDVVRKADALDLPDQTDQVRHIQLSDRELASYRELVKTKVLEIGDVEILASNALTEVMKLRQITSGFLYDEGASVVIGDSKIKELLAVLEEIGPSEPVVIMTNFVHEGQIICDALRGSGALFRDGYLDSWRAGKYQYLICPIQSAAHGLTLTEASYMIYYSMTYSSELYEQSRDRIHRIGQTRSCTYIHLIAPNTIDAVIYDALKGKVEMSKMVLNYLKRHGTGW